MKIKPLPPLEYLRECFELSDTSPSGLVWKVRPREHFTNSQAWSATNARHGKKSAGTVLADKSGKEYYTVTVAKIPYYVHRIVYSLLTKSLISEEIQIDHKDGNGLNNASSNLRLATGTDNSCNKGIPTRNTSTIKGVSLVPRSSTWRGDVWHKGVHYYLGASPSKEVMEEIVKEFRENLHKEFTNHGN